jgi:uncharacterized protein
MAEPLDFSAPLPAFVDARKVFRQGMQVQGFLPLASLPRLAEILTDTEGRADVRLKFDFDEGRRRRIHGEVSAQVNVQCQRCLDPVSVQLSEPFDLALVGTEEMAKLLPAEIDPWLSTEDSLPLSDLIEEQLILCMPIVNTHASCQTAPLTKGADGNLAGEATGQRNNPFAVLASLKSNRD